MARQFLGKLCHTAPNEVLPNQDSLAQHFLGAIVTGEDSVAWAMIGPKAREGMTYSAFTQMSSTVRTANAPFGPGLKRISVGMNYGSTKRPLGYFQAYRFLHDSNTPPYYAFAVVFADCYSTHVDGFQLRSNGLNSDGSPRGISTAGDEQVQIEGVQNWSVGGRKIWIDGVSLIPHPANGRAIMTIRVWQKLSNGPDVKERATMAAIPIIRHALERGLLQKASTVAHNDGRALDRQIGVTFIVSEDGLSYRVFVDPERYER